MHIISETYLNNSLKECSLWSEATEQRGHKEDFYQDEDREKGHFLRDSKKCGFLEVYRTHHLEFETEILR